jgi:hypothetical protein
MLPHLAHFSGKGEQKIEESSFRRKEVGGLGQILQLRMERTIGQSTYIIEIA